MAGAARARGLAPGRGQSRWTGEFSASTSGENSLSSYSYALQEDIAEARDHFLRWHQAVSVGAQRLSENRFWLAEEDICLSLLGGSRSAHGVEGADLATGRESDAAAVQINMPREPGTVDGLAQMGKDSEGRLWLLRQGRLRPNRVSSSEINDRQFAALTGLVPAFETPASSGSPARLWYKVCRLDADPTLVRAQTVEFVRHCQFARERAGGRAPIKLPAGNLERARALHGKLEPAGQYEVPAQDRRIADRRHGEIVNALIAELDQHGIPNQKVWSVDGYEIDLAVGTLPAAMLVEVKTSAFAQDVQTGTGQLMLYPKLMPELAQHRPVLLLPDGAPSALRSAVTACGIEVHTYTRSAEKSQQPTITFHPNFRRRCGLP